jgi:hypothetical protein
MRAAARTSNPIPPLSASESLNANRQPPLRKRQEQDPLPLAQRPTTGTRAPQEQKEDTCTTRRRDVSSSAPVRTPSTGKRTKSQRRDPAAKATLYTALSLKPKLYKQGQPSIHQDSTPSGAGTATGVGESAKSMAADEVALKSPLSKEKKRLEAERRGLLCGHGQRGLRFLVQRLQVQIIMSHNLHV